MVSSGRWRGLGAACSLLAWTAASSPALARDDFYIPPSNARSAGERDRDDVEQTNAGRVAETETERQAREARALEAEEPEAQSPEPDGPRFDLALRSGYAAPVGRVAEGGSEVSDVLSGQVPFMVDLGVRYGGHSFLGVYFSYGLGILSGTLSDACDADAAASGADVSCSASSLRFGVEFLYHGRSTPAVDPWVGFGIGAEWLTVSESASLGSEAAEVSLGFSGIEYFNLQGGVDFSVSEAFALGPFLMLTVASYGNGWLECSGNACTDAGGSFEIVNTAAHSWLALGVKATFSP